MLYDIIDYSVLRVLWWALLGVLLIGFAIMDGFDLGVATLLPFVAKTDAERRVTIESIGTVWEGNQVWLILGAGAIFAAWPPIYATAFVWPARIATNDMRKLKNIMMKAANMPY